MDRPPSVYTEIQRAVTASKKQDAVMLIKQAPDLRWSDITPESVYLRRREFLRLAGVPVAAALGACSMDGSVSAQGYGGRKLQYEPGAFVTDEPLTKYKDVTSYNNFYEFGTGKSDPARYSGSFKPEPWTIAVEGQANKPGKFQLEEFIKPFALEERIYRMRCVEGWSMVIPWVGFPLSAVIKRAEPNTKAKYVKFTTLYDARRMPGQQRDVLMWPYVEGLRLDEAMHPLAILAVGLYGEVLPNQNGAPIRLVVPWKYGFKGIKSIVKIELVEKQPLNTWQQQTPEEYGFYSNVNPEVDHPRWSQASETRVGDFFKRKTLMFNGYADKVASMYAGMDLRKNY
jgi:methionine sulfoxide reductase catalytic subunit